MNFSRNISLLAAGLVAANVVAVDAWVFKTSSHTQETPHLVGGAKQPTIPNSWTIPLWWLDGSNVTTCASDSNNCTQGTCGAAGSLQGPCLTYQSGIAARWATYSPRLQQTTTINVMSSLQTSDLVYINPYLEGAALIWNCSLGAGQQIWSQALGTVTPRNQTTGALQKAVMSAAGVAANQLLVDTTTPSIAWTTIDASGTTWNFSQPISGCVTANACTPVEGTFSTGDSVTAYVPSTVNITQALPVPNFSGSGGALYISNCTISNGSGGTPLLINQYTHIANSVLNTTLQDDASGTGGFPNPGGSNGLTNIAFLQHIKGGGGISITGGYTNSGGQNLIQVPHLTEGVEFFDTTYISGSRIDAPLGATSINDVYFANVFVIEFGFVTVTGPLWTTASPMYVNSGSVLQYPSGAGAAVANFPSPMNMHIGSLTTACSHSNATPDVVDCGISITPAHLDAAQGAAGFGGNAYNPNIGMITNLPQ